MKISMLRLSSVLAAILITAGMIACNNPESGSNTTDTTRGNNLPAAGDHANHTEGSTAAVDHAEANISGTYSDTLVSGTAKFDNKDGKVKMVLTLSVPSKAGKSVAVHFHEHGDCGDKGNLSHGHWNPTNAQHGKWGSANFHSGDIGNIKLDDKGEASFELETDLWTLGGPATTNILDKAIIVHSGEDDYTSQPSGNSGNRIGCGVVK